MRSSTVYINIFLLVLCAGCTPYQHLTEEGEELMGYYDHPMPGGIADIGYYASCHSRDSTVYGLALRRAQEYCQENGYQTFQIITHSDVLEMTGQSGLPGSSPSATNGGQTCTSKHVEIRIQCTGKQK